MSSSHVDRAGGSRRKFLIGSGAATAAWIAPSIVSFDRVGAAVGSCGTPPVQIDWSPAAGTYPTSVTANDGTVVTLTLSDPFGVADPGYFGSVFNGTTSGLDNPLLLAMSGARLGQYTRVQFDFSNPVAPCFELVDVDYASGSWEDTLIISGDLGGTGVPLTASDISTGSANIYNGTNTVLGVAPAASSTANGNVTITYPSPVDRIVIEHRDDSSWTAFQYIGVHDLRWC